MTGETQQVNPATDSVSWWSWRPGIKPRSALLIGIPLIFLALFFLFTGLYALLSSIVDSYSPPARVAGVITGYTTGILDSQPYLEIRVQQNGISTTVSPAITPSMRQDFHPGDHVLLDYSPHLHSLYALEAHGLRYNLPGGSPLGSLFTSVALLFLGLVLLPYPFVLTLWGWHDLHQSVQEMSGKIIGLRHTRQSGTVLQRRTGGPGLTPRFRRAWYGVALEPVDASSAQEVTTFSLAEEQFKQLHEGQMVKIVFSPHLHHVLSVKQPGSP